MTIIENSDQVLRKDYLKPNLERGYTRFTSLLKMFGLEDRLVDDQSKIEILIEKEINWSIVNSIISDKKREAIDFINNSIR